MAEDIEHVKGERLEVCSAETRNVPLGVSE